MKTLKRLLTCALAVMMLLTVIPATTPVSAATKSTAYTTTTAVNMRNGAGSSYKVVLELPKYSAVSVTSTSNKNWYKGSYTNSRGKTYTGYISSKYLKKCASTGTYVTTTALDMKKSASSKANRVLSLPTKSAVTVLDTSNLDWYKVRYTNSKNNKYDGYIPSKYLKPLGDFPVYTTSAKVNMRSGVNTNYSVVTVVPQNAKVTITDTTNKNWYKANYKNSKGQEFNGYIASSYVKKNSSAQTGTRYVTTASVNMRSGAGTNYKLVLTLPKNSKVTVTSTSNKSWYKASYTNSKGKTYTGYISSSYLKKG